MSKYNQVQSSFLALETGKQSHHRVRLRVVLDFVATKFVIMNFELQLLNQQVREVITVLGKKWKFDHLQFNNN